MVVIASGGMVLQHWGRPTSVYTLHRCLRSMAMAVEGWALCTRIVPCSPSLSGLRLLS